MPITQAQARRNLDVFSVSHAGILNGATGAELADIYGVRSAQIGVDAGNYDNTGDDAVLSAWDWINFCTVQVESGHVPLDVWASLAGTPVEVGGLATGSEFAFTPNAQGTTDSFDFSGAGTITFTVGPETVTLDQDYVNLSGVVAAVDADLSVAYTVDQVGNTVRVRSVDTGADSGIVVGGTNASAITTAPNYYNTVGTDGDELSLPFLQEDASNQPPRPAVVWCPSRTALGASKLFKIVLYKVQFAPPTFTGPAYKTGLTFNLSGRGLMSDFDEKGQPLAKRAVGRLISTPTV